ncbi:PREDICTED: coiled-coil domain-containing protein 162-like [Gekko japonicus]|uniref:Coiled-coil domain-containing protein 162-like n=1 Tax=Gekko japonicus TaxID=146911 RepID=A0ABM1JUF7_GEKJA|nr:PREDICTED: coiled-coil domain-containing protein 162-like [Gekko japonicus]
MLKSYLTLWKQLEVSKAEWGRLKLKVDDINTVPLYKQLSEIYNVEILYPAIRSVAIRMGLEDEFEGFVTTSQCIFPLKEASEAELKTQQLKKLLESLEIHIIHDVQKKTNKEMTLVISEKAREERNLPTELWKHRSMQENFSVTRPEIVESFIQRLMENHQETDAEITIGKDHLQRCFTALGCDIMARERSNFETYSMFYENILQQQQRLLYQKEQVAELSHEMIMEITALRARLADLHREDYHLKEQIRKEVQENYNALVQSLFLMCLQLKGKLNEYRLSISRHMFEMISEVRRDGVDKIIALKKKFGSTKDNSVLKEHLTQQEQLQELRDENSHLGELVCKLKTISCWKETVQKAKLSASLREMEKESLFSLLPRISQAEMNEDEEKPVRKTTESEVPSTQTEVPVTTTPPVTAPIPTQSLGTVPKMSMAKLFLTLRGPRQLARQSYQPGSLRWGQFNPDSTEMYSLTQGPRRDSRFDIGFQSDASFLPFGGTSEAATGAWVTGSSKACSGPTSLEEEFDWAQCLSPDETGIRGHAPGHTGHDDSSRVDVITARLRGATATWYVGLHNVRGPELEAIQNKKECLKYKMMAEQEVLLFRQQLKAARKALAQSQAENKRLKQQLDKQDHLLQEAEHRMNQEVHRRQKLNQIKTDNLDRMLEDLGKRELRLQCQSAEAEKSSKIRQLQEKKVKKAFHQVRTRLTQEHSLKLDAFQRLDELQYQLYDMEAAASQRNLSAGSTSWIQNAGISTFTLSRDSKQHFLTTGSMRSINSATEESQRPKTKEFGCGVMAEYVLL